MPPQSSSPFTSHNRGSGNRGGAGGRGQGRRPGREQMVNDPFDNATLEVRRVTRVMAGGKRMNFRAAVVVGDGKGRVGFGVAKGKDVSLAVNKAQVQAKKRLVMVPITKKGSIPHEARIKYKAVQILLKPAPVGRGIIAGGVVRTVVRLAGIQNIVSKVIRGSNKIAIARGTIQCLGSLAGASTVANTQVEETAAYVS